jgi:GST-like protein
VAGLVSLSHNPAMDNITLYMWATPNSRRVSILFEELGLNFDVQPVNIRAKEQFAPEIVALNPFGKVPIVAWQENGEQRLLFESGAIIQYFAEQKGQFFPLDRTKRSETLSWLMVALTGLGPHSASAHYWSDLAVKKSIQALNYHVSFTARIYSLLDERLAQGEYLAGDYSIADIAAYPWINVSEWTTLNIEDYKNLARWYKKISLRPAVKRGMSLPTGVTLE